MTLFGKNTSFDKLLDKATSHLLLEPDWASNMNVCDMVRQGEISAKYAIGAVKKKLGHSNPHVVIYSLNLVEAMAKNCGSMVHDEIATQDFMNQMKILCKDKDPVRAKVLELIQLWAHAFRQQPKYVAVQNAFNALKSAGNTFPTLIESDAMFASENAPEWQDSDSCFRCKTAFSTLKRKVSLIDKITRSTNVKHHCRNCGNIFCDDCSSKRSNIPKYGIEKDVRVCETCFEMIKGGGGTGTKTMSVKKGSHVQFNDDVAVRNFPSEIKDADSNALRLQKEKELELQEKEELELALALSASEAESQETRKNKSTIKSATNSTPNNQPGFNSMYSTLDTSEMDPELARYLNRNYWENKAFESNSIKTTQPSAPIMPNSPNKISQSNYVDQPTVNAKAKSVTDSLKESEISAEQEEFLSALKSSIEIFVNRMRSNQQRGRSIANDSAVQTLFLTLNAMQPQLLKYINEQDDRRSYFETLQDKLAQLRESREALDALREEHREKRRREEEEAARIRQIQMMQKLEIMRQKKQEFLDYQRQLAVDRMHQQEREMAARLAQQKQMMQMRQFQQQYPYSMQQSMNQPELGSVPTGPSLNNVQQYNSTHDGMPAMPVDQYGHPMMNQYGAPSNPEYYNIQNMNPNAIHNVRGSEPPQTYMAPAHMMANNMGAVHTGMYPMMPPQSQPSMPAGGWEQHATSGSGVPLSSHSMTPSSQPLPQTPMTSMTAGNAMSPENQRSQDKKEDQLISFD